MSRTPLQITNLSPEALEEAAQLYHQTKDVRLRTRVQMVLLSAEQHLVAHQIAAIVRMNEQSVRIWLKRYLAEGIQGLYDVPRPGVALIVTEDYRRRVVEAVRQRPRSLGQPYSLWTLRRLADYMAEQTGIRVSYETVRRVLAGAEIVLSRPQHKISSPDPEYEVKKRRLKCSVTS